MSPVNSSQQIRIPLCQGVCVRSLIAIRSYQDIINIAAASNIAFRTVIIANSNASGKKKARLKEFLVTLMT